MKIERDFSFVHPIAPGAKNGVSNVRVDAAARIQSSIAGPIKLRNTLPPLASNDFVGLAH
ncbi:MAG TPA: hypothetical protein VFQ43_00105 [Nitrososphaera sp.]|nr:hypothetical protein [Nitrososphaera sp.]